MSVALAFGPSILYVFRPDWLSLWWLPAFWIVQALGLTGLSNGAHEAVHGHLFYHRQLDRLVGRMLHGSLLLSYDVHRRYHLDHHASTGDEDDTEGVFDFGNLRSFGQYAARLVRWSVPPSPLHKLNWSEGFAALRGRDSGIAGQLTRRQALAGFVAPILLIATLIAWLVADPVAAALAGLLPLLVVFPIYAYVTALPEHFGLANRDFKSRTRNVRTLGPVQYLLWNFNLHAVHHRSPHLHFSLLPEMADKVSAPTADGYVRFHLDVLRQIARANRPDTSDSRLVAPDALGARPS